jgi:adenine-specific DNA-methyltransferase
MSSVGKDFPTQQIMRYAGNKAKLLNFIIPIITKRLRRGDTLFDLFAGTHSVGYALKARNRILANDIQEYSLIIGKALIEGNGGVTREAAMQEIIPLSSHASETYNLFEKSFPDTYFSRNQCREIDHLRYAIDVADISAFKKCSYLCCLIYSMDKVASTTGHFAEYLSKVKSKYVQSKSVIENFLSRCNTFEVVKGGFRNKCFKNNFSDFFNDSKLGEYLSSSDIVYADPPYSTAQYSRYYHVIETLVKYDYPALRFKGRYRSDRYFSGFSQATKVESEFEKLFSGISSFDKTLVLSYVNSGSGLLPENKLVEYSNSYFRRVKGPLRLNYNHSSLGNGSPRKVEEIVLVCS